MSKFRHGSIRDSIPGLLDCPAFYQWLPCSTNNQVKLTRSFDVEKQFIYVAMDSDSSTFSVLSVTIQKLIFADRIFFKCTRRGRKAKIP